MAVVLDFTDPVVHTYFVAPVVAALSVGFIRAFLGPVRGAYMAGIGIAVGFMFAFILARGVPSWPPPHGLDIIPYVLAAGIIIGAIIDELSDPESFVLPLIVGAPIGIMFWLGVAYFEGFQDVSSTLPHAGIMVAGIIGMHRLYVIRDTGSSAPVALAVGLGGLAMIALMLDGFNSTLPLVTALALALAAFVALNWPRTRFPWGMAATLSVGGAYLVLAAVMILSDKKAVLPVALTFLVFFVPQIVERVFMPKQATAPFLQIFLSLLPLAAAAAAIYYLPQLMPPAQ